MTPNETPGTQADPLPSRKGLLFRCVLIGAVALTVRLIYFWGYRDQPLFNYFFLDPLWHHQWASELARGQWLGREVFFRAPLYPYFLAVIYSLADNGPAAARIAQFMMGAAGSVLVYLMGLELFRREWPALAGGLAFALYGPMIYFEGELLIPALIVFLDLLGLLILLRARGERPAARMAASGFIFGLSAVARPNVLVPSLGLALWSAFKGEGPRSRRLVFRVLPFTLALLVAPLAVTIRNGAVGGDFVFIASQGGVNFYIGNNERADGKTSVSPGIQEGAGERYVDSVWLSGVAEAERITGRRLTPSEVSRFWYGRALKWIAENPGGAVRLYGRKVSYLVNGHEIYSNNVPYFARSYSPVMAALLWEWGLSFPAGILIPLALVGMAAAWPKRRRFAPLYIFTALYAGTILMFFVTGRYRMPLVGPFILFAVQAAMSGISIIRERKWKRAAAGTVAIALLAAMSNSAALDVRKDDDTLPLGNIGNYYLERGQLAEAAPYYRQVIEIDAGNHLALGNLATIAFLSGDYVNAERLYRLSLKRQPAQPALHVNLGLVLEKRGDLPGALAEFEKALLLQPGYAKAAGNVERIKELLKQ